MSTLETTNSIMQHSTRTSRRLWATFPLLLALALDVTLTLLGQNESYWSGHFDEVIEANPVPRAILVISPWLFLSLVVLWAFALCTFIVRSRHWISDALAISVPVMNSIGASSCMIRQGNWGWAVAFLYMACLAEFAKRCWQKAKT